jgi:hypothetical protein
MFTNKKKVLFKKISFANSEERLLAQHLINITSDLLFVTTSILNLMKINLSPHPAKSFAFDANSIIRNIQL